MSAGVGSVSSGSRVPAEGRTLQPPSNRASRPVDTGDLQRKLKSVEIAVDLLSSSGGNRGNNIDRLA